MKDYMSMEFIILLVSIIGTATGVTNTEQQIARRGGEAGSPLSDHAGIIGLGCGVDDGLDVVSYAIVLGLHAHDAHVVEPTATQYPHGHIHDLTFGLWLIIA